MKSNHFIIGTQGIFFGWLLSFPFHGPVFSAISAERQLDAPSLILFFILVHAFTFLLGGLFLKQEALWKELMLWSLVALTASTALLWFSSATNTWMFAMGVKGAASALFILGWSYPYSKGIPIVGRIKVMASTIILSNVVYILFHLLSEVASASLLLLCTFIPLAVSVLLVLRFPREMKQDSPQPEQMHPFPAIFMLIFCLFIFGLYLNSGIMYSVVFPSLTVPDYFFIYYRYIPYILVLVVMFFFGERLKRYFSAYMGASLLGLAFVSFIVLAESPGTNFVMTQTLFEAAFAFLDLFAWTLLGDIAFIYGAPFRIFGYALAAMTGSIYMGGIISNRLAAADESYYLIAAMFAVASIFLTALVMPWLNERINKDFFEKLIQEKDEKNTSEKSVLERIMERMPEGTVLTPREIEIVSLVLKGLTNREIAGELFISENTLKTHLKNIYQKVQVTQKRELLSLAVRETNNQDTHPL